MDAVALQGELKQLHHGRGIYRTRVRAWLGPQLQEILGITSSTSDDDVRLALRSLLTTHLEPFPRDLRYLFLVACGIAVKEPFLSDRLRIATTTLDRSDRVLRRRLRTAEELLADSLVRSYAPGTGPFEDQGWQWDTYDFELVLRKEAKITLNRSVRALADDQRYIHESFVFPGIPGHPDPTFKALSGFAVMDVDQASPRRWGVTLQLPRPLARGHMVDTSLQITVPDPRALDPLFAFGPLRPSRSARVRVDFGAPPAAATAWIIDGAYATDLSGYAPSEVLDDLHSAPLVTGEFAAPRAGLIYGVGWKWAD